VEISLGGRAPKQEPLLLALALCARCNTQNWKHQWMKQWQKSGDKVENASTEFEKARARYMFELSRAAFLAVEKVFHCFFHPKRENPQKLTQF
jgi:hypothetical protein